MFCGKKNTSKLEKLQERALRLVFCDQNSSYDDLLKRGNFLSLKAYHNTNVINEFNKNITESCQTCDLSELDIF